MSFVKIGDKKGVVTDDTKITHVIADKELSDSEKKSVEKKITKEN